MKIVDFLRKENCIASLESSDKSGVLKELTSTLVTSGDVGDGEAILDALNERERLGSTGIGEQVAIPHAKVKEIGELVAAFGKSDAGVDYAAVDDRPVRWIFLLLASENNTGAHLKALARISRLLKSDTLRSQIDKAKTADEIYKAIEEEDSKLT